jgi:hypothetical protein
MGAFLDSKIIVRSSKCSSLEYCVVHRCPSEVSRYLSGEQHSSVLIFSETNFSHSFLIDYSNFSENYLNGYAGSIEIGNALLESVLFCSITDNKIASEQFGIFLSISVIDAYLENNNLLRNVALSTGLLSFEHFGKLNEKSNFFDGNNAQYFLKFESWSGSQGINVVNSFFGSNTFNALGTGYSFQ